MIAKAMAKAEAAPRGLCGACAHFEDDGVTIERGLPGLMPMSSAHGATRSDDGLCLLHDRYLRASATCPRFTPRLVQRPL